MTEFSNFTFILNGNFIGQEIFFNDLENNIRHTHGYQVTKLIPFLITYRFDLG